MEFIITALGPDHRGLADPIIHDVTERGGRIAEIQMDDHDQEQLFAMLCRVDLDAHHDQALRAAMAEVAAKTGLAVRVWSPPIQSPPIQGSASGTKSVDRTARIAIAGTFLEHTPRSVLDAVKSGRINGEVVVMLSNRRRLTSLANEFNLPFECIGDDDGMADDLAMVRLMDQYQVDYLILARYMRILPASTCWQFAGGRIINLHHGLLPGFPGFRPYHDAYAARMLTFGATCHFIIPELDAGNQTINQRTFSVLPGTPLEQIIATGQRENEPECLVEGVRRVCAGEVRLHFHRVIATGPGA
ncbi:MAG: formyltransferase family protein [Planctomycetota bacterium]